MYKLKEFKVTDDKLVIEYSGYMSFQDMKDETIEMKLNNKYKNISRVKFYKLYK